jgi:hypothetical protein
MFQSLWLEFFSRMKWQSTSIYFVRSWNTELDIIWCLIWLSQYIFISSWVFIPRSTRSCLIHVNSLVVDALDILLWHLIEPWKFTFYFSMWLNFCLQMCKNWSLIFDQNVRPICIEIAIHFVKIIVFHLYPFFRSTLRFILWFQDVVFEAHA